MAMNNRSRGIAASTGPHGASSRPLYQDFTPQIEAKDDPQANTVYIHLPGFSKEQLRIVADTSRGVLRVRGERPLAGIRWSRFLEEVPVPENCDMTETKARFEGGALRITMPKKIPAAPAPPQSQSPPSSSSSDEPASPQPSPPPALSRPTASPPPQPVAPRPAAVPLPRPAPAPTRPAASRPAAFLPPEPAMPRPSPPQPEPAAPRPAFSQPQPTTPRLAPPPTQPPAPRLTPSIQRKPRDDPKPLYSPPSPPPVARLSLFAPPPLPEVARISPRIQPRPRDEIEPRSEPAHVAPPLPLPPAMKPAPTTLHTVPQPALEPPRIGPIAAEMIRRPTEEKQSPAPPSMAPVHLSGGGGGGSSSRVSEAKERGEGEKKRKVVKGWLLEEEGKMLVNMGAAALVIAGLGAWISYTLSSSAKSNN